MKSFFLTFLFCAFFADSALAQSTSLNQAKYMATLKVIVNHKMHDRDLQDDLEKLRNVEKFSRDLQKMVEKLDNNRPNSAKNQKIMRILENTGKEIYNELK